MNGVLETSHPLLTAEIALHMIRFTSPEAFLMCKRVCTLWRRLINETPSLTQNPYIVKRNEEELASRRITLSKLKERTREPVVISINSRTVISGLGKYIFSSCQDLDNVVIYTVDPKNSKVEQREVFEINLNFHSKIDSTHIVGFCNPTNTLFVVDVEQAKVVATKSIEYSIDFCKGISDAIFFIQGRSLMKWEWKNDVLSPLYEFKDNESFSINSHFFSLDKNILGLLKFNSSNEIITLVWNLEKIDQPAIEIEFNPSSYLKKEEIF